MGLGRFLGPPGHDRTFVRDVRSHSNIRVLPDGNSHGCVAQWTSWGGAIVLELIILGAIVGSRKAMLVAEFLFTVLTFERSPVDGPGVAVMGVVLARETPQ